MFESTFRRTMEGYSAVPPTVSTEDHWLDMNLQIYSEMSHNSYPLISY